MKKTSTALLSIAFLPALACAQSSVTIYGILDEGVNWTTNANGPRLLSLTSGVASGSRIGLQGREDLGGGKQALFVLENGFDVGTGGLGQGGRLFGRQSFVGLGDSQLGTLTLGRQYDSVVDTLAVYQLFAKLGGYVFARPGDIDNLNNAHRVNNALKYSGNFSGVMVTGLYGFGETAGSSGTNQIYSLGASYTAGALSGGIAYLNVHNPNTSFFSDSATSSATNNINGPVYSGYASASSYQVLASSLQYTLGASTLGLSYSNVRFLGLGDTSSGPNPLAYHGTAVFNSLEGNYTYRISPAWLTGAGVNLTRNAGAGGLPGATYRQFMAGVDYSLSKRTDIYLVGAVQRASGTDSTGKAAVAAINGPIAPSSDNQQAYFRLAIRHRF
ncbi:porin [Herbaspirillum sp. NPDC087042]|uniref:porin n=1 Tax=Herbaspirillum sp. NPDC087042 TaxID=3364004 RepID=UPI0038100ECD